MKIKLNNLKITLLDDSTKEKKSTYGNKLIPPNIFLT